MFLKKTPQKNGKVSLAIVEGYRDAKTGKTRHRVVKSLGFLHEYEGIYEDPIAHFEALAEEMTRQQKKANETRLVNLGTISLDEELDMNEDALKYLGYLPLSYLYHQLRMREFWVSRQRNFDISYSLNDMMQLLIYMRVLEPDSKRHAFMHKHCLPFNLKCEEYDIYRALDIFDRYKDDFLLHVHEEVRRHYGRTTEYVFYDVKKFYFEIDEVDDFKKRGFCKHKSRNPLVQMGLLLDDKALPITYELFEGNTHDSQTMMPILQEVRRRYGIKRLITVADKALNSGDNIAFMMVKGDGFIFSQKVKGAAEDLVSYVFDPTGYKTVTGKSFSEEKDKDETNFYYKSRPYPQVFHVTHADDRKRTIPIDVKQIVCFNRDYANRQKHKRREAIAKANELIRNPGRLKASEDYDAKRYIANLDVDATTGECLDAHKFAYLDEEKIREDERYDGFYVLITSEVDTPDSEIIRQYHNLWEIEKSFRVTKHELRSRPVYLSLEEHIRAHFFTCFMTLLLVRLLCLALDNKFGPEPVIQSLRKYQACFLKENIYRTTYFDEVLTAIQKTFGLNLNRKYMARGDLRSLTAQTKKH
jgi:transposase